MKKGSRKLFEVSMKKGLRKQIIITAAGVILLLGAAIFSYNDVKNSIVANEQESLKSLAKVNAKSLQSSLEAKANLLYAVFSGSMAETKDIETGLMRLREKGRYIPLFELNRQKEWERKLCEQAKKSPGAVITGPVKRSREGYYALYMTKAVGADGSITGYVLAELNLDEIYAQEQALSSLRLDNDRYCIVNGADGMTVMPGNYSDKAVSLAHTAKNGCTVEWVYETENGTPKKTQKLIACESLKIAEEEFYLYIIEDYEKVIQPIERIALYFCLLGTAAMAWASILIYKISEQQKKEVTLVRELQHEKTLNEAMKEQEGLMQKYNHSKTMSVLTGSIAHEFNNLMTPIVLYADLLEENDIVSAEMPEEIAELRSSAGRCEELARQLLSYSRQGKAEKVYTDYDASFAIQEAANIVKKLLPKEVRLKENISRTPYYVHGQLGALNQILLNLTTNALHAMQNGGTLRIQFGLSTDDGQCVRLVVEDTGTGIAPDIRQKVFHPFFTTKQPGEGTGIGLTVVKRLTEEHGGTIRVKTEEGKGTLFILDFPRVNM